MYQLRINSAIKSQSEVQEGLTIKEGCDPMDGRINDGFV